MHCIRRRLIPNLSLPGLGLLFCFPSIGQEIGSEMVQEGDLRELWNQGTAVPLEFILPFPEKIAEDLMDHWDFVADGEFHSLPQDEPARSVVLKREYVIISFQIEKLYKGDVAESIKIELPSDMLVFPGEDISRYVKREQIKAEQYAEIQPIIDELRALRLAMEAGQIDPQEYRKQRDNLDELVNGRRRQDGLPDAALPWTAIDYETFYDKGGAIRPNQKFLIGLKNTPSGNDVYKLEEHPDSSSIFWGEMRDYILPGLDGLAH